MIASLTGRIAAIASDHVVIDVVGVGYLVYASARTLARIPAIGSQAALLVDTQVREDAINLYGFLEQAERDWFRLLTTVQGVGARTALAVLGVLDPDDVAFAVAAHDTATLTQADGVGRKLATRIVTELKDRAGALALSAEKAPKGRPVSGPAPVDRAAEDAVSALVNLGYSRGEAFGAISRAAQAIGRDAPTAALITAGLKELAQ
jgi:Holliday junction DNA helicase RuvA